MIRRNRIHTLAATESDGSLPLRELRYRPPQNTFFILFIDIGIKTPAQNSAGFFLYKKINRHKTNFKNTIKISQLEQ